jgi:trans-aconitate 2-methyltransferase
MKWDPDQYGRYADERGRPFHDLVGRIHANEPRRVFDLGCGPGNLTATLGQRWPAAQIEGIDSSAEMIAKAPSSERVRFSIGDIASWTPPADVDVVLTNAALQWVPGHPKLLRQWATQLPAGAWLAWQVPDNFRAPSHELMRQVADSPRWADQLGGVLRLDDAVLTPDEYAQLLMQAGFSADVWTTTYLHVLPGADPVLDWLRGTGLRPVLATLSEQDGAAFEHELGARLHDAYPSTPQGTLLPFQRIFAVGQKR